MFHFMYVMEFDLASLELIFCDPATLDSKKLDDNEEKL